LKLGGLKYTWLGKREYRIAKEALSAREMLKGPRLLESQIDAQTEESKLGPEQGKELQGWRSKLQHQKYITMNW
jgi:hypothetical protein